MEYMTYSPTTIDGFTWQAEEVAKRLTGEALESVTVALNSYGMPTAINLSFANGKRLSIGGDRGDGAIWLSMSQPREPA